jgi:hypothetical protein
MARIIDFHTRKIIHSSCIKDFEDNCCDNANNDFLNCEINSRIGLLDIDEICRRFDIPRIVTELNPTAKFVTPKDENDIYGKSIR